MSTRHTSTTTTYSRDDARLLYNAIKATPANPDMKDLAKLMGLSNGATAQRWSRLMRKLRKEFETEDDASTAVNKPSAKSASGGSLDKNAKGGETEGEKEAVEEGVGEGKEDGENDSGENDGAE